jgi:hypothetical protein
MRFGASGKGISVFARAIALINQAMLTADVFMICIPSSSNKNYSFLLP